MKDMTFRDLLVKTVKPLVYISIYKDGIWQFVSPLNPIKVYEDQSFYLMSYAFGLVSQGTFDPKRRAVTGVAGDYVVLNSKGDYTLVTKAEYARQFPPPNLHPPERPNNSSQIKDKNFLTNILKGSGSPVSNSKISKPTPPNSGY
jgi:hypothetical protein